MCRGGAWLDQAGPCPSCPMCSPLSYLNSNFGTIRRWLMLNYIDCAPPPSLFVPLVNFRHCQCGIEIVRYGVCSCSLSEAHNSRQYPWTDLCQYAFQIDRNKWHMWSTSIYLCSLKRWCTVHLKLCMVILHQEALYCCNN